MNLLKVLEIHLDYILQTCLAHNLKVTGSNPDPETNLFIKISYLKEYQELRFWFFRVFSLIGVWLYQPLVRFIYFNNCNS